MSKSSSHIKEKTAKKAESKAKRTSSGKPLKKQMETEQISDDADANATLLIDRPTKKSNRPENEVVIYNEVEFDLKKLFQPTTRF